MDKCLNTVAFGKNDIRGIFPSEVNSELFFYTALGYVKWVRQQYSKMSSVSKNTSDFCFCVAMDARLHSPELKKALVEGILATSANVLDIGLVPTPLGYFSEFAPLDGEVGNVVEKIDGALIITASHNPSEYNGLKMTFNKQSLNEEQIQEVKKYALEAYDKKNFTIGALALGSVFEYNLIPLYIDKISKNFDKVGNGIKVVVDSANATGGVVAPELYRELGCDVVELYSEPDGNFPNHHPNPSDESTLKALSAAVVEHKADCGIAFDGDSDRIGVVNSDGVPLSGDKLLLIFALDLLKELVPRGESPTVVSEVKCSQVLYDTINQKGGTAVMYKTGHGYIKSKMRETKALLAGEMSGHIFFKDRYFGFDDAVYAGCRLVEIIAKNKKTNPEFKLQELLKPFDEVFLSKEVRLACANELKAPVLEELEKNISEELFGSKISEIITIDGLRVIFEDGFALIRQSNTEPVFTMRFEAKCPKKCEHYEKTLINEVEKTMKAITTLGEFV
ncbi:phosphomannomutase / phosphoglucomutase [Candidatus Gastranaerophilus sp. (ex Termes propinquus)]|nr:phosphomannomutase / phosphoglucomutase [Candidatus Gastranaerophilus sp. (ex Termes propinquus)]